MKTTINTALGTPYISFTQETTPTFTQLTSIVEPTLSIKPTAIIVEGLVPEKYKHLIGIIYPPLPEGMKGSESLIFFKNEPLWAVAKGQIKAEPVIWMSKMIQNGKKPTWQITDIVELPEINQQDAVFLRDGCMIDGKYDPEIIAIAIEDEKAFNSRFVDSSKILYAWKMDRIAQVIRILEVTTALTCYTDSSEKINN